MMNVSNFFKRQLSLLALLGIVIQPTVNAGEMKGTVDWVRVFSDGNVLVRMVVQNTYVLPDCSTGGPGSLKSMVFDSTSIAGQQWLSLLLSAHATDAPVTLVGSLNCSPNPISGTGGREEPFYITYGD